VTVYVTPETVLRGEIWTSLVAMLRSYAAVHPGVAVKVRTMGGLDIAILETEHADLELDFRPGRGVGMWHLKKTGVKESGNFEVQQDGTLILGGKPAELDMAAMDLVERLVSYEHGAEGGRAE
jgi:hypothetical protein